MLLMARLCKSPHCGKWIRWHDVTSTTGYFVNADSGERHICDWRDPRSEEDRDKAKMEAPIQHQQTSEILLSKVDELSRHQQRILPLVVVFLLI
jgi:hypothetical protein